MDGVRLNFSLAGVELVERLNFLSIARPSGKCSQMSDHVSSAAYDCNIVQGFNPTVSLSSDSNLTKGSRSIIHSKVSQD
jgi:hypothetical protein